MVVYIKYLAYAQRHICAQKGELAIRLFGCDRTNLKQDTVIGHTWIERGELIVRPRQMHQNQSRPSVEGQDLERTVAP